MKASTLISVAHLGGPGLDGYAYKADTYCIVCGKDLITELAEELAPKLNSFDDPEFRDSEFIPQPIFFGEADTPQHCGRCDKLLPVGLTDDGLEYVRQAILDHIATCESAEVLRLWVEHWRDAL